MSVLTFRIPLLNLVFSVLRPTIKFPFRLRVQKWVNPRKRVYGSLGKKVAVGTKLRIDNGSQYTSDYFLQQIRYLGIQDSFGLVRQPETNGVAERFHRTLKEQIFEGRSFKNVDEVREAVRQFVEIYNQQWLVAKRGYQSPIEARLNYNKLSRVA